MEGMQYINHRVVDGVYQAVLYWKVEEGKVYVKEGDDWTPVNIDIRFIPDFVPNTLNEVGKHLLTERIK